MGDEPESSCSLEEAAFFSLLCLRRDLLEREESSHWASEFDVLAPTGASLEGKPLAEAQRPQRGQYFPKGKQTIMRFVCFQGKAPPRDCTDRGDRMGAQQPARESSYSSKQLGVKSQMSSDR
ncbi:hypothetical protein NDU88_004077 [Pleurodeles waltl]|uniref:Uncharacterized protein n=1 Tax=Pleurodeles waltl TaxID=8319 RepID=A0AAV7T7C4_PLEWA|nr:hypothetical protein NDU88_004077 [Pleurodeles waltl]